MKEKLLYYLAILIILLFVFGCESSKKETVSFDSKIEGVLEPDEVITYFIQSDEKSSIYFSQLSCNSPVDFTLTTPDGSIIFNEVGSPGRHELVNYGPVTLKEDGYFELKAKLASVDSEQGNFEFIIWLVDPLVIKYDELEFDTHIEGETLVPGQTVEYEFAGDVGQVIMLAQQYSHQHVYYKLYDQGGKELFYIEGYGKGKSSKPISNLIELERSGFYSLIVGPVWKDRTASFEFIMWDVNPTIIQEGLIELNKKYSGETNIPGQKVEYIINGKENQTLGLNILQTSKDTNVKLLGPHGEIVLSDLIKDAEYESDPLQLMSDGQYVLIFSPEYDNLIKYEFVANLL